MSLCIVTFAVLVFRMKGLQRMPLGSSGERRFQRDLWLEADVSGKETLVKPVE